MATASRKALFFIVCLPLFIFISSAYSSSSDSAKVSLGLYYESLCPFSANFIVNYLTKLFDNGDLLSITDLHLSPWGNARLKANDSFVCQHGPSECLLNTVEACAINAWPKPEEHFPFINCIEALVYEHNYHQWETCFEKLELDPKPIADCYTGRLGKELELQYAAETNALQPPHQYVPWVVVDGQPLYEDYENFVSYIYAGSTRSKALPPYRKLAVKYLTTPSLEGKLVRSFQFHTRRGRFRHHHIELYKRCWMQQMNEVASTYMHSQFQWLLRVYFYLLAIKFKINY